MSKLNQIRITVLERFLKLLKIMMKVESFENFQTIETTFLGLLSYLEDILTIGLQSV